jgi:predicted anti-sigma-YlaC factor YlaD
MADDRDLTCQELVELVTDYLEGALPPAEVARFDAHLVGCSHCRVYLEQMRLTIRALGRLPATAMTEDGMRVLLEQLRGRRA